MDNYLFCGQYSTISQDFNHALSDFLFYGSTVLKDRGEELQRLLPEVGEAQGLGQRRHQQRSTPTAELSPREALEGSLVLVGASCASLGIVAASRPSRAGLVPCLSWGFCDQLATASLLHIVSKVCEKYS